MTNQIDLIDRKTAGEIVQPMVDALRTIASGKKDYGEPITDTDYSECRKIARNALRRSGL